MSEATGADRHRYYEQLAVSHVLGGLSESDGQAFRSHLLECGECRARVGELRGIANDLADVERDERRERAATAVETKRREAESESDQEEAAPDPRPPRIAVLVGLALLVGLAGLVFIQRGNLQLQSLNVEALQTTTDLLIDGAQADVESPTGGFSGGPSQVRYDSRNVVVVLDGVKPDEEYAIYQLGEDGDVVAGPREPELAVDTRMTLLVPRARGLTDVVVTRVTEKPRSQRVSGDQVLTAAIP